MLDRNFTKFLLLTPGTQQLQWQHAASENPQGSTQTMVNGQHFSGTSYQLDGTENRDPILGIIVINPTLESIGETKITSQNYDAEFGQATAGVVSVQTKSGGNSFHGSAFEFFRNDALAGAQPVHAVPGRPADRQVPSRDQAEPVRRLVRRPDREEQVVLLRRLPGDARDAGWFAPADRADGGCPRRGPSAYGVNIYDPQPAAAVSWQRDPAGPAVGAGAAHPRPDTEAECAGPREQPAENYVGIGIGMFEENSINVRIDGRLGDKLNTFGRYSLGDFFRDGPTSFGQGGGQELVSLGGVSDVRNHSLAYGMDYTMSPTMLADFRFGFFQLQGKRAAVRLRNHAGGRRGDSRA